MQANYQQSRRKATNPKWPLMQQSSDKKDEEESSEKKPCTHGRHQW